MYLFDLHKKLGWSTASLKDVSKEKAAELIKKAKIELSKYLNYDKENYKNNNNDYGNELGNDCAEW